MDKPFIRYFLFGNAVHEYLIPLLCGKMIVNYDDGVVFVCDSGDARFDIFNGYTVIKSDVIPSYTQVIVPPAGSNLFDMRPGVNDSIFIADYWPVLNNESMDTAANFRNDYPYCELHILLFESVRKTSSTDVRDSDSQSALGQAIESYEREGFPVITINRRKINRRKFSRRLIDRGGNERRETDRRKNEYYENVFQEIETLFFWQNRDYDDMLRRDFNKKLADLKEKFDTNYEMRYELLEKMLKQIMLYPGFSETYTKYNKESGVTTLNRIAENAAKKFFDNNSVFTEELTGIIEMFTKDIRLWDYEKIIETIRHNLSGQFVNGLKATLPAVTVKDATEISYMKFFLDSDFNTIFAKYCNAFFNETARETVKEYINGLFVKMEECL